MKLVVFSTHPIQYQVPIFQELVRQGISLKVFFASDHSVMGGFDKGFDREVKWDIPLLEGYDSCFLKNLGSGPEDNSFTSYRCPEVKAVLEKERPDAVLIPGYNRYYYLQVVFWCRKLKIPLYLRGNNMDGTGPLRKGMRQVIRKIMLKWLYRRFDGFFSIGNYMTEHYLMHGVKGDRIKLTPYCNNSHLFEAIRKTYLPRRRWELRKELGIPEESFVAMTSGRFIDWKRVDLVVEALAESSKSCRFFLVAIGDGPEYGGLVDLMKERMPGAHYAPGFVNQSDLGRYYACADAFVLASDRYHETWGLVVNEAMTFSLPCIVSDGVGCRNDLIEAPGAGKIFCAGDRTALLCALEEMALNPAKARAMGERGYRAVQVHSVQNNAQQIISFLLKKNT